MALLVTGIVAGIHVPPRGRVARLPVRRHLAAGGEPYAVVTGDVLAILSQLSALGCPEDRALAGLGIERTALSDPDTRFDDRSVERLWQSAIDTTGDPSLPLRAARRVQAGDFAILSYIAAASRDSRSAFETLRKLLPSMSTLADIDLDASNERPIVRYHRHLGFEISVPTRQYAVGTIVQASRAVGSHSWGPEEAWFAYPPPDHAEDYERILELPLRFDASHDAVVFSASMLDDANPASDPALVQALERDAHELLAKRSSSCTPERRHALDA